MVYNIPTAFVLLVSALSHCYYVFGAVVSLLVPFADPDNAVTANFLRHGTLVADATNAHEVSALNTVLDRITATITATGECSLATGTVSGASAACSFSGNVVDAVSDTTTTVVITTAYTSLQTLMAVQIPDTWSGAIPTAAATSSGGTASSSGSAPTSTSTGNSASKERLSWGIMGAADVVVVGLV